MMNERIQKLCKQAFSLADDENDRHVQEEGEELSLTQFDNFFYAKFAELIIRECIAQVRRDENGPAYEAVGRIAGHFFGVEE